MDLSNENVVHINKDGIQYLQFRRLLEYKDIIKHAYSVGKNINFRTSRPNKEVLPQKDYERAINNYKNLSNSVGMNYINVIKPNQKHTKNVMIVDKKVNDKLPDINLSQYNDVDGTITNKKNLILATTNADCTLLLFFDPVKKVIANVHSGWRGTLQRISEVTVKKMINEFKCNPKDIICCICPSIRKCHFEVDKDVMKMFKKEFLEMDSKMYIYKQKNKEKWNIDTIYINNELLKKQGLKEENIIDSGICSVCNSELIHSYRSDKEKFGLAVALIQLN